jgi:hypothetical protein
MRTAVKVTTDGQVTVLDLDSVDSELRALQEAVGGWIQAVDVVGDMSIYLNEEGKMIGLPINPVATSYFDETWGAGRDVINGDVVFTGLPDSEGDTTGLTPEQLANVMNRVDAS